MGGRQRGSGLRKAGKEGGNSSCGVCPPAGIGLLRLEQPAQRDVQEVRAGTGQRLMTKPSHVHALPTWSL